MRISYQIIDIAVECENCETAMKPAGSRIEDFNSAGDDRVFQNFRCPACGQLEEHVILISEHWEIIEEGTALADGQEN